MKKLLLLWLFSGSLDGFSQYWPPDTCKGIMIDRGWDQSNPPIKEVFKRLDTASWRRKRVDTLPTDSLISLVKEIPIVMPLTWEFIPEVAYWDKPDTLRATLIVYYDSGPAILHTKPGFVVRRYGKDDIYLDDKKKVIKAPLEVFSYKFKNNINE